MQLLFGGAERVIAETIENIDRSKFLITPILFTPSSNRDNFLTQRFQANNQPYHLIATDTESITLLNPLRNIKQLRHLLHELSIDLVHTHGYRSDVITGLAVRQSGIPIVSTCHGFIQSNIKMGVYKYISGFFLKRFSRVLVVSKALQNDVIQMGVDSNKTFLLPNAIKLSNTDSEANLSRQEIRKRLDLGNDFVLGYVGRLSTEKGLEFLLKAIGELAIEKEEISIKALIVGDGPEIENLKELAQELQIQSKIHFIGFQSSVDKWLAAMDTFVLPSITEGTPMALLEAMSNGIPVIASKVGGIPSVIRNEIEGILVPSKSPLHLQEAIQRVYFDQNLRSNLSTNAKNRISEHYNIDRWIKSIEALYEDVIGDFHY